MGIFLNEGIERITENTLQAIDFMAPTKKEAVLVAESSKQLAACLQIDEASVLQIGEEGHGVTKMMIPQRALQLFLDILTQLGKGNAVSLTPVHEELTTQEAADLLNVSRPYFVQLLEKRELPYRKVGSKRRVLAKDVLSYKTAIEEKRQKVLDQLAAQAQELDMGY